MTLKLIVIRHAKSAWDDPLAEDHARILNDRGRRSAKAIGSWLAERGHRPDQLLSSDSARTTETVTRLLAAMGGVAPEVRFLRGLYHAPAARLLAELHKATGKTVAIVAHNPGIGDFADRLVAEPPAHPRFADYPTAATTVMTVAASAWNRVGARSGEVVDFVVPRDLIGDDAR